MHTLVRLIRPAQQRVLLTKKEQEQRRESAWSLLRAAPRHAGATQAHATAPRGPTPGSGHRQRRGAPGQGAPCPLLPPGTLPRGPPRSQRPNPGAVPPPPVPSPGLSSRRPEGRKGRETRGFQTKRTPPRTLPSLPTRFSYFLLLSFFFF